MSQKPSVHVLPIFRNTRVADEPGPGRIPVDHEVNGQRIQYWRETVPGESFRQFPLVLNADGSPWAPAVMWLLDRARANPTKAPSLNPVAQGLRAYKVFLDEAELEWDDFSAVDQNERPTYRYRAHLQDLINRGVIQHSTASSRMHTVVGFYRFLEQSDRMGFHPQHVPWAEKKVGLHPRVQQLPTPEPGVASGTAPTQPDSQERPIRDGGLLKIPAENSPEL